MKYINLMILTIVLLIGSACATQHYGRLQALTYGEVRNMSCQDINLEIVRAQAFIKQTRHRDDEFTYQDFTGFLGDLTIGNIVEYHEAMDIAKKRLHQLQIVQGKRKCKPTGK